jgi:hypothetical protein
MMLRQAIVDLERELDAEICAEAVIIATMWLDAGAHIDDLPGLMAPWVAGMRALRSRTHRRMMALLDGPEHHTRCTELRGPDRHPAWRAARWRLRPSPSPFYTQGAGIRKNSDATQGPPGADSYLNPRQFRG